MDNAGTEPPTNLMAEQNGLETVLLSWTAPSVVPSGYRIIVDPGGITVNTSSSSHNISLQPGVYSIQVISLSPKLSIETVEPVNATVRGTGYH